MLSGLRPKRNSPEAPLSDYDSLIRRLYLTTAALAAVAFMAVLLFYSLNTALSYLLGAVGGMLYFRMLDRGVRNVGPGNRNLGGAGRIALFAVLMIVTIKSGTLEILPTFFGFLTVKAAILFDTLRTLFGDV